MGRDCCGCKDERRAEDQFYITALVIDGHNFLDDIGMIQIRHVVSGQWRNYKFWATRQTFVSGHNYFFRAISGPLNLLSTYGPWSALPGLPLASYATHCQWRIENFRLEGASLPSLSSCCHSLFPLLHAILPAILSPYFSLFILSTSSPPVPSCSTIPPSSHLLPSPSL